MMEVSGLQIDGSPLPSLGTKELISVRRKHKDELKDAQLNELLNLSDPDFGMKTTTNKDLMLKVEKEFAYYE